MAGTARGGRGQSGSGLSARLEARRPELEEAILNRVHSVADPSEAPDPAYREGLRAAVAAALDYGLAVVELGEERSPPPPPILLTQARLAARHGIGLDTVLRRYLAGHALLGDCLVAEAERCGIKGKGLRSMLRAQATLFDRLVAAVSEEHARESRQRPSSTERRRAERIDRLLAGEMVDTSGLAYDFEGHHIGAIASGPSPEEALRELAARLDRQLLMIGHGEDKAWAWLGGRRALGTELRREIAASWPEATLLALGEPAQGLDGWRLTHRQARAALPIAMRGGEPVVRYADVALLASILRDDLFATSLRKLYLEPLEEERDGGEMARETLRAYFAAGRNVSSAAAALGVARHTVANRLRVIEEKFDGSLGECSAELDAALRLAQLVDSA